MAGVVVDLEGGRGGEEEDEEVLGVVLTREWLVVKVDSSSRSKGEVRLVEVVSQMELAARAVVGGWGAAAASSLATTSTVDLASIRTASLGTCATR